MLDFKSKKVKLILVACAVILIIAVCVVIIVVSGKNKTKITYNESKYFCSAVVKNKTATFTIEKDSRYQLWEVSAEETNHLKIKTTNSKKSSKIEIKSDGTTLSEKLTFMLKDGDYVVYEMYILLSSSEKEISVDIISYKDNGKKLSGNWGNDYSFYVEKSSDVIIVKITQDYSKTYTWITENDTDLPVSDVIISNDNTAACYIEYDTSFYGITDEKQIFTSGEKEIRLCEVSTQTAIKLIVIVDEENDVTVDSVEVIECTVADPKEEEKNEFAKTYKLPNIPENATEFYYLETKFSFDAEILNDEVKEYDCGRISFYIDEKKADFLDIKDIDILEFEHQSIKEFYQKNVSKDGVDGMLCKEEETYFAIWQDGKDVNIFKYETESEEEFISLWQKIMK